MLYESWSGQFSYFRQLVSIRYPLREPYNLLTLGGHHWRLGHAPARRLTPDHSAVSFFTGLHPGEQVIPQPAHRTRTDANFLGEIDRLSNSPHSASAPATPMRFSKCHMVMGTVAAATGPVGANQQRDILTIPVCHHFGAILSICW